MIYKKYPKADLANKRHLFFGIGLVISLLLVITAFEWKFYDDGNLAILSDEVDTFTEILEIPVTEQPPPPLVKTQVLNIVEVEDMEEIELEIEIELDIEATEDMTLEIVAPAETDMEEEEVEEILTIVETYPQPIGGYKAFYEFISDEIRYPQTALRIGIHGKVFIQFVVDKDGTLTDFHVAKGIGAGCDEEALRVLRMAPKWDPGKQRGKTVKVRMILPISFSISM